MKKWEISLASGAAIAVLLSACGGTTPVKKETASKPETKVAMLKPNTPKMTAPAPKAEKPATTPAASGRFAGAVAAHDRIYPGQIVWPHMLMHGRTSLLPKTARWSIVQMAARLSRSTVKTSIGPVQQGGQTAVAKFRMSVLIRS